MSLISWPGLIDVHVHLREPGAIHKEDFLTGSKAAVKGGFTYILDMPNNPQPTVSLERLEEKIRLADEKAVCGVGFHFGTNGDNLLEFSKVWNHPRVFGLKIYCNHTTGEMLIEEPKVLDQVFVAWKSDKPILVHAEGSQLKVALDLAKKHKRRLHVCHISQASEVELVRQAKKAGLKITAGVTPHHLFLTSGDELMKPSLGSLNDQRALWRGLKDGTIDLVESDHAPHTREEKEKEPPAFGVPGLETSLGLMLKAVKQKKVKLNQVKQWLYGNPKKIFKIPDQKDSLIEFDPNKPWMVDEKELKTKCGWSPFNDWKLYGKVEKAVIGGQVCRI